MPAPDNKQEKRYKKGEFLCLEGDVLHNFYIIQSGKVSVYIERGGQKIEVIEAGPGQIIGEQGVFGFPKQAYTCVALSEVKCIELPVEPLKMVFEKAPKPLNLFIKSLGEEIRKEKAALRTHQSDKENAPCPPRFIPRLCAILSLVAKNAGKPEQVDPNVPAFKREELKDTNPRFKDSDLILAFHTLKIYTSRMFFESHQRMESFCELLDKLGYLTCIYEKNEDTEKMELDRIRMHNIEGIEMFGEFYQHNFFKPGRSEVIHIDKFAYILARAFVEASEDIDADRRGLVNLDYKQFLQDTEENLGFSIKESHIQVLEKKGLFLKRQPVGEQVMVSFDKAEYQQTYAFWKIINEIDHWNESGSVDKETDFNKIEKGGPTGECPSCKASVNPEANFCPQCGHKLADPNTEAA